MGERRKKNRRQMSRRERERERERERNKKNKQNKTKPEVVECDCFENQAFKNFLKKLLKTSNFSRKIFHFEIKNLRIII